MSGHRIARHHTPSGQLFAVVTCSEPEGAPCRSAADLDFDPLGSTVVDVGGCCAVAFWAPRGADRFFLGVLDTAIPRWTQAQNGPVAVEERLAGQWWWRYVAEGAQAVTGPQEAAA